MGGYDLSEMDLQELKQVDVRTVDPDTLVDIKEIEIDRTLPKGADTGIYPADQESVLLSGGKGRRQRGLRRGRCYL